IFHSAVFPLTGKMLRRRGGTPMSPPPPLAEPVDPTRVRTLPPHFAWIDHRLRDRLRELSLEEIALLVFLHLAADKHGLSFWSDATIARKLHLSEGDVIQAPVEHLATPLAPLRGPRTDASSSLAPLPLRVAPARDGTYEVLDGFKRLAHWRHAGHTHVPVIVEEDAGAEVVRKA